MLTVTPVLLTLIIVLIAKKVGAYNQVLITHVLNVTKDVNSVCNSNVRHVKLDMSKVIIIHVFSVQINVPTAILIIFLSVYSVIVATTNLWNLKYTLLHSVTILAKISMKESV